MINQEKVKIYIRYGGDIDSWVRSGSKKEKLNMTDWYSELRATKGMCYCGIKCYLVD
jgi:hypothetical protein